MRQENCTTLLFLLISVVLFASFSLYLSGNVLSSKQILHSQLILNNRFNNPHLNFAIREDLRRSRHVSSLLEPPPPDSILLPDWEVLLVLFLGTPLSSDAGERYYCLFQNNATYPAKPAGLLPFTNLTTFRCVVPKSVRRFRSLLRPILTKSQEFWPQNEPESRQLFRWGFLAYESLSTEDDVILFVKGVNHRQGVNRSPTELRCVFGDGVHDAVQTAVTSSSQEVFRCSHPDEAARLRLFRRGDEKVKVSLQGVGVGEGKRVAIAPSVAYYTAPRKAAAKEGKSLLCTCTMVHNVAKFLREWVVYHSKIGVEKFILYDNGSDDGLKETVEELLLEDYNVTTFLWPWPKTQEAGFSHCAMHARDSCTWMMYIDVDEFVFSPSWLNSSHASNHMLRSILSKASRRPLLPSSSSLKTRSSTVSSRIGQILIRCLEFGPSNQRSHPVKGVIQGYTCRRRIEQRHKSIVLLDGIDVSLINVIHHFQLKEGYRGRRLSTQEGLVNHYKYQAWPEFQTKFQRRVSAYVADWRQKVNPMSKDRTPGLGFAPIEPKGWHKKFCEVNDTRLKVATKRWFGLDSPTGGYKMAWQDE